MLKSSQPIEHEGVVCEVKERTLVVKIVVSSACAACHAKGSCLAADMQEKLIEVAKPAHPFVKDESVWVCLDRNAALKAVFLGYGLPFIVLVGVLATCLSLGFHELTSGLFAILALFVYYGILYLKRGSLARTFQFFIRL